MIRFLRTPTQFSIHPSREQLLRFVLVLSCVLLNAGCLTSCDMAANSNANVSTNVNANARASPSGTTVTSANANTGRAPTREEYERHADRYQREAKEAGRTIGSGANDGWLWVKVRFDLQAADDLRDSSIEVDVDHGVVTLTGEVTSKEQKVKAVQLVKQIEGVRSVRDALVVKEVGSRPSPSPQPSGLPSPPATPSPSTTAPVGFDIDSEVKKLKDGAAITEVPTAMELGETRRVVLVLSPDVAVAPAIVQERTESLQRHDQKAPERPLVPKTEVGSERAAYGKYMEAKLTGQGFEIRAATPERQPVTSHQPTTWTWDVKATGSGEQYLYLSLNAIFEGEGSEKTRAVTTFNKTVKVNVSWRTFVSNYWQWLVTAIALPALGGLWALLTKRKKDNKES